MPTNDADRLALRAIVFDFDGTLADSYAAITASVNFVRAQHKMPPMPEAEVRRHVGRGPAYLLEHTVASSNVEADVAQYRAHHPSVLRTGTRLLPGVEETLAALAQAGYLLGVCSNKPGAFTRELLDYLSIAKSVRVTIGPEDAARLKPAPDMLMVALARLGVTPGEALYVGDMVVDIETARATGVEIWVIPTGSDDRATLVRAQPDRLMEDFCDLLSLVGARA